MSRRGQVVLFLPAFAIFLLFLIGPVVLTVFDSFFRHDPGGRHFVGGAFYRFALSDSSVHRALANNLGYLFWTFLFEVLAGLGLALGLEKPSRLNQILRVAFFSPSVLSLVVVGLIFGFVFKDGIGLFPGMLQEGRALLTVSLISGWAYCGFYMAIFLAALANIPDEVLEASKMDGAGRWATFWQIKLPLLRPVLLAALLICFTGAFKAFDLFWVIVPNQDATAILATVLVREVLQFDNRGYASALAVVLGLVVFGIVGAVALLRRRVHSS